MAVTFSDLHAESGLKSLDEFLAGKSYISGYVAVILNLIHHPISSTIVADFCVIFIFRDSITKDDIKVYGAVLEKPGGAYPNASKWFEAVSAQLASRLGLLNSLVFLLVFLLSVLPTLD